MAEDKYYINCSYNDKDEAKLLGARWDPDVSKWYIPSITCSFRLNWFC